MKKFIVKFVILILLQLNCIAQPNGGFENWTSEFSYDNPDGWETLNFLSLTSPPNPVSVFKASGIDRHSGIYAMKIKTVYFNNNPSPYYIDDSTGVAFTGKITVSPFSYIRGFPYTNRPEKLEFWSKYIPVGNDSAGLVVILTKWNGLNFDTIGGGGIVLSSTPNYSLFQISLNYYSNELPDSAFIAFLSSRKPSIARVGSKLFIDDVQFTGWVGIAEQNIFSEKVKTFPNPVRDNITISAKIEEAKNIRIFNISGELAGIYEIQDYKACINTSLFAEGLYLYEILDKKNKILFQDKFSVIR